MKKIFMLLLTAVLCLSLVACDSDSDIQNPQEDKPANNQPSNNKPSAESETTNSSIEIIPSVNGAQVLKEGSCGSNATFKLYNNGVLVISGTGSVARENPFDTYGDHLKYIRIEEGITDIEDVAFCKIDSFSIVELPNTLKTIGDNAFRECFGLKTINFPEGLESIGEKAFGITNIQNILLPSTITEIAEGAFSYNDSLNTIIIPGNVKTIGKGAFQDCDELTTIILCEGVETIEEEAFDANGMRKMAIPDSVTSIGRDNIDYRTKVYCNDSASIIDIASGNNWDVDTIIGYDGFIKNYDIT